MKQIPFTTALLLVALSACVATPDRYVVPAPEVTARQTIAFQTVEISAVSLPAYAAADEISVQDETGKLASTGDILWADTPSRAVALELTRHLTRLTGARVASTPWPFESFPDARVEVRFETLVARSDGSMRAAGQYFVAATNGGRERTGLFDLTAPFDPDGGPPAIAAARGQVILELATTLARSGLR